MPLSPGLKESGTETFFAPPERDADETVAELAGRMQEHPHLLTMLEAIPGLGMILNSHRQILMANRRMIEKTGVADVEELLGQRLGESLGCVRAGEGPSGCGTGPACALCGATASILESQCERYDVTGECRISIESVRFETLEFEVVATPLRFEDTWLTVCAMRDISGDKRRRVLERIFFHDVLNTAGGLKGLAQLLVEGEFHSPTRERELKTMLAEIAEHHVQEIEDQKQLMAAENGDLRLEIEPFQALEMLRHVRASLANHPVARGREIVLWEKAEEVVVESDLSMVRRILVNMTKNALEATEPGQPVTLGCSRKGRTFRFSVHNPGGIPPEVQVQIFNRSFSTKAKYGRGIGTYSMKLLGETYLRGRVGFESNPENGTTFWFELPLES